MSAPRLRALPPLAGHTRRVSAVALTADGQHLLSASLDRTLRLWSPATGACDTVLSGHTGDVNAAAISPDGKLAVSGAGEITLGENLARVWDVPSAKPLRDLVGHEGEVSAVALNARRGLVASGSADATVRLWDLETGKCLREIGRAHV